MRLRKNSNLNKVLDAWRLLSDVSVSNTPLEVMEAEAKLGYFLLRSLSSDKSIYFIDYPKKNK